MSDLNYQDSYLEISYLIGSLGELELCFESDEFDTVSVTLERDQAEALYEILVEALKKDVNEND